MSLLFSFLILHFWFSYTALDCFFFWRWVFLGSFVVEHVAAVVTSLIIVLLCDIHENSAATHARSTHPRIEKSTTMLRRNIAATFAPALAMPSTTLAVARRGYTDYHHHKFPYIPQFYWAQLVFICSTWLLFLSLGSVWWESNRAWKSDTLRSWRRLLGTGYRWSDEWGPQVDTIFTNLPTRAE